MRRARTVVPPGFRTPMTKIGVPSIPRLPASFIPARIFSAVAGSAEPSSRCTFLAPSPATRMPGSTGRSFGFRPCAPPGNGNAFYRGASRGTSIAALKKGDRTMRQPFLEAAAFAAALWLLGAAARAQDVPSPTPTPAPSPTPAPTRTPAALALPSARDEVDRQRRMDGAFMTRARLRGLEEIKLGQIVAQRSANDGVRSLARHIIEERG